MEFYICSTHVVNGSLVLSVCRSIVMKTFNVNFVLNGILESIYKIEVSISITMHFVLFNMFLWRHHVLWATVLSIFYKYYAVANDLSPIWGVWIDILSNVNKKLSHVMLFLLAHYGEIYLMHLLLNGCTPLIICIYNSISFYMFGKRGECASSLRMSNLGIPWWMEATW